MHKKGNFNCRWREKIVDVSHSSGETAFMMLTKGQGFIPGREHRMNLKLWIEQPRLLWIHWREKYFLRKYIKKHFPKLSRNQVKILEKQYTWKSLMKDISTGT